MPEHWNAQLLLWKLWNYSFLHNGGAGHAGLPYRSTVPSLCSSRVFQGEWDLHERVWNRHEEMIVFLKVKGEDKIFQRHTNWETYWHFLSTPWNTQIIWIYTSAIYAQGIWLLRLSKQRHLCSWNKIYTFFHTATHTCELWCRLWTATYLIRCSRNWCHQRSTI